MSEGAFFEILLYAALAAFVLMRLRSVLGRRTGHERPSHDPFAEDTSEKKAANSDSDADDNVIPLPGRDREAEESDAPIEMDADTLPAGITRIKLADDSFEEADFLRGARGAFEMIVQAFASGDRDALKPLLSADLHRSFGRRSTSGGERETETTIVTVGLPISSKRP